MCIAHVLFVLFQAFVVRLVSELALAKILGGDYIAITKYQIIT